MIIFPTAHFLGAPLEPILAPLDLQPDQSVVLMAPLAKVAGCYAEGEPDQAVVKENQ
jgi:hypothetical protein